MKRLNDEQLQNVNVGYNTLPYTKFLKQKKKGAMDTLCVSYPCTVTYSNHPVYINL